MNMRNILRTRLKFFVVTAAIMTVIIGAACSAVLITLYEPQVVGVVGTSMNRNESSGNLFWIVLGVGAGCLAVLLVAAWFLSHLVVRPAKQSLDRQTRFIQEASHEIKTPLTIILTGVELLEKEKLSPNATKWLGNIKQQADKMNAMATDLLELSKIDEKTQTTQTEFDLGATILSTLLGFENVTHINVVEGINYRGNPKDTAQAISILCDNAIKHSAEPSQITVELKKQASRYCFTITNPSTELGTDEIPHMFERFWRGSEARARTQGHGLGLAILKRLADKNGWRIDAKKDADTISISILF